MNEMDQTQAQEKIGKTAVLRKGLLRGQVKVTGTKWAYGRTMFLVVNDRGESQWVNADKLEFTPQQANQ